MVLTLKEILGEGYQNKTKISKMVESMWQKETSKCGIGRESKAERNQERKVIIL